MRFGERELRLCFGVMSVAAVVASLLLLNVALGAMILGVVGPFLGVALPLPPALLLTGGML